MKVRTFTAVIHREDDLYVATCPELGTVSQGTTIENALANLKEATELYLEEFPLPDVGRPLLTTFEATALRQRQSRQHSSISSQKENGELPGLFADS
jgi:predicted RNase H-like HicB family nuclease